jgi:hypothetical protein
MTEIRSFADLREAVAQLATEYGLQMDEETSGRNGYPQCLCPLLTGFASVEDFNKFSAKVMNEIVPKWRKENKCFIVADVDCFRRRDGWNFFEKCNMPDTSAGLDERQESDVLEEVNNYDKDEEELYLEICWHDNYTRRMTFDEAIGMLEHHQELWKARLEKDPMSYICTDSNGEIVERRYHVTSYREDVWTYVLGIKFDIL